MDLRKALLLNNGEFWAVSVASLFRSFGFGMAWPFFSIYFSTILGISTFEIGLIFTASAIISIFVSIGGGVLGDFFGRRSSIVVGSIYGLIVYFALALLTYTESHAFLTIILFVLSSLLGSLIFPASSALIADVSGEGERRKAYSLFRVVSNIGWAAGPLTGAFLYVYGMWVLLVFLAATSIVQLILTIMYVGEHRTESKGRIGRKDVVAYDYLLILFSTGSLFMTIVSSQFLVSLPLYAVNAVHIQPNTTGYIFAVNGAVVIFGQGPLTRLFRGRTDLAMMITGVGFYSIGYFLVGLSTGLMDLMLAMIVITIGEDLVSPALSTVISVIAPKGKLARYMAFNSMMNQTARAIGPSIGSIFLSIYAYNGIETWGSISLFGIVSILMLVFFSASRARRMPQAVDLPSK